MMFAVIKTGGKQYRVAEDQLLQIEKIKGEPGEIVQLSEVLMLGGETTQLGAPMIAGASVAAEVIEQGRGAKVIAFKKRRRKNSRRKRGHRQEFTLLRITEILTDGKSPSKVAKPRHVAKPKPEATAEPGAEGEAKPKAAKARAAKAKAGKKPSKPKASGGKSKKK
jgi:large subunit ribosomal protein L21